MQEATIQTTTTPAQATAETLSLAPAENGSVNWKKRIRVNAIHKYWLDSLGVKELKEDETCRITAVIPFKQDDGLLVTNQLTLKKQVRSADELIQLMERSYAGIRENIWKKMVGFSISSATFKAVFNDHNQMLAPNKSSFISLRNFVIDLDSHNGEGDNTGRFNFNSFTKASRRIIAAQCLNKLNKALEDDEYDLKLHATSAYATGGGLQFIISFDREVVGDEADTIFKYMNASLKPLTKKFSVLGVDAMGKLSKAWFEFDTSSTDTTHTQRVGGTVNPKEMYLGAFSEEIEDFYNEDLLDEAKLEFQRDIEECSSPEATKELLIPKVNDIVMRFKVTDKESDKMISVDNMKSNQFVLAKARAVLDSGNHDLFKSPMDYEVLKQISFKDQKEFMERSLTKSHISTSKVYTRYVCPFHPGEDAHSSFAIYPNERHTMAYAHDYHDSATYNLIQFVMKARDISRSQIMAELQANFDLKMTSGNLKQIHKDDIESDVTDELIKKVDVENFVYYRLANKQRSCVIRSFDSGDAHVFDGTRMLSDHILVNQLKVYDANMEKRAVFHEMFVEKILINAFEEFRPGQPYTYERSFIKYVNLWIPGKDYLKIHELAESIEEMDLDTVMGLIKDTLPNMWFYLNQMTQKGSLPYFMNWLVCVAQFKRMSSIPIVTSVQGSGKGVFVTQVLEYYLNHEYVNVVNTEKVASNFNAFMEKSSLIVLDEGDFSKTHDVDNLKMLTGNNYVQVEKKGVDSVKVERHFNMLMLTNGEVPIRHPFNDRRMSYFRCDVTLADSVKCQGFETIDDFIFELQGEVQEFWAMLVKTKPRDEWTNMNIKDNQFNKQILLMHPFGKLVIDILHDKWTEIKLQMSETFDDPTLISANLEMIDIIKSTYDSTGMIDLTLINRYIKSLPFKSYTSVLQFIKVNKLELNGITIIDAGDSIKIGIDRDKVKNLIKMSNNLGTLFACYNDSNIEETLNEIHSAKNMKKEQKLAATIDEIDMGIMPHDDTSVQDQQIQKPTGPAGIIQ